MRRARGRPHVLIATPVKNADDYLGSYFALLGKLSYPADCLSLGFLESDSTDGTYAALERRLGDLRRRFRRVGLWKHDFGVDFPTDEGRWAERAPARTARASSPAAATTCSRTRSTTRSGSSGSTST